MEKPNMFVPSKEQNLNWKRRNGPRVRELQRRRSMTFRTDPHEKHTHNTFNAVVFQECLLLGLVLPTRKDRLYPEALMQPLSNPSWKPI